MIPALSKIHFNFVSDIYLFANAFNLNQPNMLGKERNKQMTRGTAWLGVKVIRNQGVKFFSD